MIALGVQLVFNGHGAGDAADIQVGVHGAVVRAAADLAESHGVDVLVGGILKKYPEASASVISTKMSRHRLTTTFI